MRLELPIAVVIALNALMWPVIQLGLAWGFTRMPARWFDPPRGWRCPGETPARYERWFRVHLWKDSLPDGASWFAGGVPKSRIGGTSAGALRRFAIETWRGELCHWAAMAFTPLCFLWNPPWACAVMATYAVLANLPCVMVQRYNRIRIQSLLARRGKGGGTAKPAAR